MAKNREQQSIRDELIGATDCQQSRRESDKDFLHRLTEAVAELDDKSYRALSKDAKAWADDAVNKLNDEKPIPAFPDEEEAEAEQPAEAEEASGGEGATEEGDEEVASKPRAASGKTSNKRRDEPEAEERTERRSTRSAAPASKTKGKADPAPAAKSTAAKSNAAAKSNGNGAGKPGGLLYVRELLCKDPDTTVADLQTAITKKGYKISDQTLHTTRSGFRQDMRAMQEAGLLKRTLLSA